MIVTDPSEIQPLLGRSTTYVLYRDEPVRVVVSQYLEQKQD
jgi:hypothetical protein